MTVRETIVFVRMLLDDGLDWFNTLEHVIDVINEAQLRMIDYWVATRNERALRPLFYICDGVKDMRNPLLVDPEPITYTYNIDGTDYIRKPLYVRSSEIFLNVMDEEEKYKFGLQANFIPVELFLNNEGHLGSYEDATLAWVREPIPQNASYTIRQGVDSVGEIQSYILFTYGDVAEDSTAMVSYVAEPLLFGEDQELEVSPEYHYEVCTLAAEILNGNDVGERMRSKVAVPEFGQKLDILLLGSTDAQPQQEQQQGQQ